MSAAFEIEKGVPIPPRLYNTGAERSPKVTALLSLDAGDSIFFCGVNRNVGSSFRTRAEKYSSNKYTLRTVEGGVRIWRVS